MPSRKLLPAYLKRIQSHPRPTIKPIKAQILASKFMNMFTFKKFMPCCGFDQIPFIFQ
jgi:hypothetical protein